MPDHTGVVVSVECPQETVMRVRLHGTPAELGPAMDMLRDVFEVGEVGRVYPDRPPSPLARLYLTVVRPWSAPPDPATVARLLPRLPAGPVLVVLIGAAGSGKSTLARACFRQTEVESLDRLRARVTDHESALDATGEATALLHQIIGFRLARHRRAVVDATNTLREVRAPLLAIAAEHRVPAHAVVLATPLPLCVARNQTRPAQPPPGAGWPRQVPAERQADQHAAAMASVPGLRAEGFTTVDIVTPTDWPTTPTTGPGAQR